MNIEKLIIECGSYIGEETAIFLENGYKVIAIDANPEMCQLLETKFKEYIETGRLIIKNVAISENNGFIDFYKSKASGWCSTKLKIANRGNLLDNVLKIESIKLSDLISTMNIIPYFIKMDIEGNDIIAINSLIDLPVNFLPEYISCETECLGVDEEVNEEKTLETLNALRKLGYNKFKLFNQTNNAQVTISNYEKVYEIKNSHYNFDTMITNNEWADYDEARTVLLTYRNYFFTTLNKQRFEFWCDWLGKK